MASSLARPSALRRGAALALGSVLLLCSAPRAGAQDAPSPPAPPTPPPTPPPAFPPPQQDGLRVGREQMWSAPTEKDWAKPVLITWQRTWDDAVAVAKETGRPILVCVNMDGEIASEHYAGVRYRQPEITALYEPYVCVIASVYRHTPRDHDDQGRRIPCPRFGGVTCAEHIAMEPIVFEKFLDGQRIAPRHICVELDGKETFDVYYRNDTASVFQSIRDGISMRPPLPPVVVRGDRPVAERVASRDVRDRVAVEAAYEKADAALRASLLEAAKKHGEAAQLDLLRLAVFGADSDASKAARAALAKVDVPEAATLVADALRVPMDAAERDALIAVLERMGEKNALAQWLAVLHRGLAARSTAVDPKGWAAGAAARPPTLEGGSRSAHLEYKASAARARPNDPAAHVELAEASLLLAMEAQETYANDPRMARFHQRRYLEAARAEADRAAKAGATDWRVDAVAALAAYYAGDVAEGYARAEKAVRALPPGDTSWASMAVLTVFSEGRWKKMKAAVKERERFPREWLADVNAAYSVLLKHPLGTEGQVLWHQDVLDWLGAYDQAARVLRDGIGRFRDSTTLHAKLREHTLRREGPAGLEAAYEALTRDPATGASLIPFAADASLAAAEHHRRARAYPKAIAAYGRAIALYERAAAGTPARGDAVALWALAHAGRARTAYEAGDDEGALADVLASFQKSAATAGTRDAMGVTPGETGQMLLQRLKDSKRDDLVARLDAALKSLDAELLRPDRE